ncbi:MAG: hypothetical protein LQ352_007035, partial [Teloschistes flavicans]
MAAATGALEEGTKRGQEIRRKDQPPPPRNRPDFYPSSHSSYAESSNSQGPQGSQPQGSSWYGPSNPTYSSYNSSSPVQEQQPGYGQYPPAQQTGYPYQGTGYNPQQAPTTGQQPAYPSGTQAPGSYNHQGQYQTSHGYPPPSGPQNSASPTHFSTGDHSLRPIKAALPSTTRIRHRPTLAPIPKAPMVLLQPPQEDVVMVALLAH